MDVCVYTVILMLLSLSLYNVVVRNSEAIILL